MIVIAGILSGILGGIFLASSVPKLRHPKGFLLTVLEYRILPSSLSMLYARLVPWLELLIALLLLSGTGVRSAATITVLLLLSFMIAVSINLARGRDLDCNCFGKGLRRSVGWGTLLQEGILASAAIALGTIAQTWAALEPWSIFRLVRLSIPPYLPLLLIFLGAATGFFILLRGSE